LRLLATAAVVANQRDVLLHAVDGLLIVRHDFHGDLQEAHHGTILEIDHQGGSMA
jgi:hypothetical protein